MLTSFAGHAVSSSECVIGPKGHVTGLTGSVGRPSLRPLGPMPWQRPNIGSRVNREVHARFWERPGVRFPRGDSTWTDEPPPRLVPQGCYRSTLSNGPALGLTPLCGIDSLSQLLLKRLQSSDGFENIPACSKCILTRESPDAAGADTEHLCIRPGLRGAFQDVVGHLLLLC